ncbi:MAG: DUF4190 domain-containing protein [Pirellulales bacterium]
MSDNPFADGPGQQSTSSPQTANRSGNGNGLAIAALVLGIVGFFGACLPICRLPLNIIGIVLGVMGLKSDNLGMAIAGLVLCIIGLLLTLANAAFGAYLAMTGQNDLINAMQNQ